MELVGSLGRVFFPTILDLSASLISAGSAVNLPRNQMQIDPETRWICGFSETVNFAAPAVACSGRQRRRFLMRRAGGRHETPTDHIFFACGALGRRLFVAPGVHRPPGRNIHIFIESLSP